MESRPESVRPRSSEHTTCVGGGLGGGVVVDDKCERSEFIACGDDGARMLVDVFPVGEIVTPGHEQEVEAPVETSEEVQCPP